VSLTGPAYGENPVADRLMETAGYELIFSNFTIQRINPDSGGGKQHVG
jgi:hypothetical protein